MTPLTPTSGIRAAVTAAAHALVDRLTHGDLTRRINRLDEIEQANRRLVSERQTALEAAEDAWNHRDRMKVALSETREDLARVGRVLADCHLIARVGGPHLVRAAVEAALVNELPPRAGTFGSVADTVATAIAGWTGTPGKAGLLEAECTELGWVAAAAVRDYLQPELIAKTAVQG